MPKTPSAVFVLLFLFELFCMGQSNVNVSSKGFLTSLPPEIPVLMSPENQANDVFLPCTLSWRSQIHTSTYSIQVSSLPDFANNIIDISGLEDTVYTASSLENSSKYYWRVGASSVAGESGYAASREFITIIASPDTPLLAEPVNNATDIASDTVLKWNSVPEAAFYHLQLSRSPEFSDLVIDESNLADTLYSVSGLENGVLYYWRVKAINVGGKSNFSNAWSFRVEQLTSVNHGIASAGNPGFTGSFPNPFHAKVIIRYYLPEETKVTMVVYNCLGQLVAELLYEQKNPGAYEITWDGNSSSGNSLDGGLYICELKTDDEKNAHIILIKN